MTSWLRPESSSTAQLLVIEPLFEEANRCRRLIAQVVRRLEGNGVTATIAVLPGTGESEIEIADVRLRDWVDTVKAMPQVNIASFRGGTIIDCEDPARNIWRFAPEAGARIVRDLRRAALTGGNTTLLAGHRLNDEFVRELEGAIPAPLPQVRTVRLESDAAAADLKVAGTPLWRRAEPGEDAALAAALADDLIAWMKSCAAS